MGEKVYVGMPIYLIVIFVIFLEIFAVSGIKSYDVSKNGDRSQSKVEEKTKEDDNSDTLTSEQSTETDNTESEDLSVKEGLLHKSKEAWEQPEPCSTLEEYHEIVNEYILSGSDEELVIKTVGLDKEDFESISAEYMTQPFGWPDSCSWTSGLNTDEKEITQKIKYDESYYVYRYVVYGDEIPKKETKAIELYNEIDKMLQNVDLVSMSDYQKELYFHDYIIRHAEYDYDALEIEDRTDSYSAYGLFVNKKSVCDGYTRAMGLLLSIAGIDNYYVSGDVYSKTVDGVLNEGESHAWNMVKIEDNWYLLDATWDDGEDDVVKYSYFNVNDEIINSSRAAHHRELYPSCTSMQMNYYIKNNLCFETYEDYSNFISDYSGTIEKIRISAIVLDYSEDKYDFSEVHKLLGITDMRYSVNMLSDNYVEITIYTY